MTPRLKTLVIPKDVYDAMVAHCIEGVPNEACGFIGGKVDGTERAATKLYPMTNAAASPVFYRPDDREMLAALRDMDEHDLDVASIFHSHVATRAYPSPVLNVVLLGQNYHLVHHAWVTVPWFRYRPVFEAARPDLERRRRAGGNRAAQRVLERPLGEQCDE